MEILFGKNDASEEIKKHIPYLFIIPGRLSFRHPGYSDFGRKYFGITSISQDISELLES